jgi:hypothetical protein
VKDEDVTQVLSVIFANAVMTRFDALMGKKLVCSPVVFEAALEVARMMFGPTENPLAALDEVEELERIATEEVKGI